MIDWMLDLSLIVLCAMLALGAQLSRNNRSAVVLFIVFGLVMALLWARLGALDLAIAEAAIGAGLTGMLLLQALRINDTSARPMLRHWALCLIPIITFLWLTVQLSPWHAHQAASPQQLAQAIAESGVTHPVTAILLNIRAIDTLFELIILAVTVMNLALLKPQTLNTHRPWPIVVSWSRFLLPWVVLLSGYVLWRGTDAPGGAFQAGAILASGLIVMHISQLIPTPSWYQLWVRMGLWLAVSFWLGVGILSLIFGLDFLTITPNVAPWILILIEVLATFSIAVALAIAVVGWREQVE